MTVHRRWLKQLYSAGLAVLLALTALPAQAEETITYIHWDAQGSPVAATDEDGNVVWRESYRPYGERINNEAPAGPHTRWYTDHPQDPDTGLVYAGARYYDPVIGRFLSVDPVEFQEDNLHSFNRYAYGSNNPYRYIDPDGRESTDVGCLGDSCFEESLRNRTAVDAVSTIVDLTVGAVVGGMAIRGSKAGAQTLKGGLHQDSGAIPSRRHQTTRKKTRKTC